MKFTKYFDADYCRGHDRRFALSLEWIAPLLASSKTVVDFGQGLESSPFDLAAKREFPGVRWLTTENADLRYRLPFADGVADGICLMEAVEHLRDREEDPLDFWGYTGIRNCLAEACRILRPGGWLFLTTPNGSRYTCAWNVVRGESPAWVRAHIRELGYCEAKRFVEDAGFVVERIETHDVFDHNDYPQELAELMDRLCPDVPRGHCIFCLARKPEVSA